MEVVQIIGNTNESTYADGIAYEIEKFEVSNGVNIKKIGVCYDKTPDINAKEIYHDYDAEAIICLHIKHPIEFVEVPKDRYVLWHGYDPTDPEYRPEESS